MVPTAYAAHACLAFSLSLSFLLQGTGQLSTREMGAGNLHQSILLILFRHPFSERLLYSVAQPCVLDMRYRVVRIPSVPSLQKGRLGSYESIDRNRRTFFPTQFTSD